MKKITVLILVAAILTSGCAVTTNRTHPDLAKELEQIETVVVAPPQVTIELVKFKGDNERDTELEAEYKKAINDYAIEQLTANDFKVVEFDFESTIQQDSEFAYLVNQVREDFEQARKDLRAGLAISEAQAQKLKATLGEAVRKLSTITEADAVLLTSYNGMKKSGGSVAKDVGTSILVGVLTMGTVVPVQATNVGRAEAALIDGTSGDVLWTNFIQGALTETLAETTLSKLPQDIDATSTPAPLSVEQSPDNAEAANQE